MYWAHDKGQPHYTPSKFYQQSPFSHSARNIPSFSTSRQQQNYQPAMHNQRFNRNQPFNKNRCISFRQNAPQSENGLCYYHAVFGERARKFVVQWLIKKTGRVLFGSKHIRGEQNF